MDGKIDKVRDAISYTIATLSANNRVPIPGNKEWSGVHKGRADSAIRQLQQALASLSAIDPESIKRECAYKAKQAILSAPYDNPTRAYAAALAEAAIFSAEPAQDDGKARFRCRDCNSEFDESVMEYYCDDEDGEGDYIGECPVCGSRNLAEAKRRLEEAKE